jgi:hypothetical protein
MTDRVNHRILRAIIPVLALGDGVIHLSLDFVLFHGNFFGAGFPSGRPPGAGPSRAAPPPGGGLNPFVLPLNELFLLNFFGSVVLVLLFLFGRRWLGRRRWLVDVVMIAYAGVAFVAWLVFFGRPNPMGLGYISKGIEIVLIIALILDIWRILRPRGIVARES